MGDIALPRMDLFTPRPPGRAPWRSLPDEAPGGSEAEDWKLEAADATLGRGVQSGGNLLIPATSQPFPETNWPRAIVGLLREPQPRPWPFRGTGGGWRGREGRGKGKGI